MYPGTTQVTFKNAKETQILCTVTSQLPPHHSPLLGLPAGISPGLLQLALLFT